MGNPLLSTDIDLRRPSVEISMPHRDATGGPDFWFDDACVRQPWTWCGVLDHAASRAPSEMLASGLVAMRCDWTPGTVDYSLLVPLRAKYSKEHPPPVWEFWCTFENGRTWKLHPEPGGDVCISEHRPSESERDEAYWGMLRQERAQRMGFAGGGPGGGPQQWSAEEWAAWEENWWWSSWGDA